MLTLSEIVAKYKKQDLRVAIMGGTFNPIHNGHIECAQAAFEGAGVDFVLFIVANMSNFKQNQKTQDAFVRLKMCKLAIAESKNSNFYASDIEINRQGISYTVDTISQLKQILPKKSKLYFILGSEALLDFTRWHNYQNILENAKLLCVSRGGYNILSKTRDELKLLLSNRVEFIDADVTKISSTEIRGMLLEGHYKAVSKYLPKTVFNYILNNKLYEKQD